jgi:hypothetical protein
VGISFIADESVSMGGRSIDVVVVECWSDKRRDKPHHHEERNEIQQE